MPSDLGVSMGIYEFKKGLRGLGEVLRPSLADIQGEMFRGLWRFDWSAHKASTYLRDSLQKPRTLRKKTTISDPQP